MSTMLSKLKAEIQQLGSGTHRRYQGDLRKRIILAIHENRPHMTLAELSTALDISYCTIEKLEREKPKSNAIIPISIEPRVEKSQLRMSGPFGLSIEGDIGDIAELIRVLST